MVFSAADNTNPDSLASRLRRRRMQWFGELLGTPKRPVRILDVGGTPSFWQNNSNALPGDIEVTLLNIEANNHDAMPRIRSVVGDARRMEFDDRAFDVVFSNSVIEHVGTLYDQLSMAREIARVAPAYFVQTPNRYFPMEPHFLLPLWQFCPFWFRARLHQTFKMGWMQKEPRSLLARADVEQIRLLSSWEMGQLFPEAEIRHERLGPLTKSLVALRKENGNGAD